MVELHIVKHSENNISIIILSCNMKWKYPRRKFWCQCDRVILWLWKKCPLCNYRSTKSKIKYRINLQL